MNPTQDDKQLTGISYHYPIVHYFLTSISLQDRFFFSCPNSATFISPVTWKPFTWNGRSDHGLTFGVTEGFETSLVGCLRTTPGDSDSFGLGS